MCNFPVFFPPPPPVIKLRSSTAVPASLQPISSSSASPHLRFPLFPAAALHSLISCSSVFKPRFQRRRLCFARLPRLLFCFISLSSPRCPPATSSLILTGKSGEKACFSLRCCFDLGNKKKQKKKQEKTTKVGEKISG